MCAASGPEPPLGTSKPEVRSPIQLGRAQFHETIKAYCRRPSKVSYKDYNFDQLPPRFLAADGLHPSFTGVALLAEMLKNALARGEIQAATG
ncbi:hypothetical protein HPB50_014708 [Hyalomma asiaticum]|uniref:Uncharacterized protein n=1 Tax=Hyalomma asiaticum TaxID=266040 RepID=A0ACB7RVA2_HYAAI|nr:hypothetical protein HPB50_014708 [Hyalomma asiaticum]